MSDNESAIETELSPTTEKFKEYVREWIRIHDRLSEIRRDTSSLNKRKKEVGAKVMLYMKTNEKEMCNLGDQGSLQMKVTKTSLALKKNDIESILIQMGRNETDAKDTAEFLFENKRKKETSTLRRNLRQIE